MWNLTYVLSYLLLDFGYACCVLSFGCGFADCILGVIVGAYCCGCWLFGLGLVLIVLFMAYSLVCLAWVVILILF